MKLFSTSLSIFLLLSTITYGQSLEQSALDPYGFVTKYDIKFDGIGPKVYILPLPRTLKDEMIDTYKEIQNFQDSIRKGYQYERLLSRFLQTSNAKDIDKLILDKSFKGDYNAIIQRYSDTNNHTTIYGLYNSLALDLLSQKKTKEAAEALNNALSHATIVNNEDDIAIIRSNLASIYILSNNLEEALKLENSYLQHATKNKNTGDQAISQDRIALIQAYAKNYSIAENTIIRKAIPLFNKSQFYDGKVEAWITLAEIYRTQNKHTEAQWFLLQARDLAKEKGYDEKIATIEYLLGSSKLIQQNYKVANAELQTAWDLNKNNPNKFLQLAIAEQLGHSFVYLKDYKKAKTYLDYYWELRNLLF
ncbi:tetratricopeptide repeat protein [Sphingobacterium bovistauri]|uniref:Tetratricopeptide repeat protein n=1 Tax=Sphingobacterium bovistauri TaxID=2781959 RepID=A0ABS7Z3A4_9SPHI|nr:tetratricopeptide repeat protein [Sphingobacterium bovistauri]MCA5004067.1 tetratricopeptide repeat protein [Sphingobacterium bovistauri]